MVKNIFKKSTKNATNKSVNIKSEQCKETLGLERKGSPLNIPSDNPLEQPSSELNFP